MVSQGLATWAARASGDCWGWPTPGGAAERERASAQESAQRWVARNLLGLEGLPERSGLPGHRRQGSSEPPENPSSLRPPISERTGRWGTELRRSEGGPGWGSVGVGAASAPVSEPRVGGGTRRTADRPSRPSPAPVRGVGGAQGPLRRRVGAAGLGGASGGAGLSCLRSGARDPSLERLPGALRGQSGGERHLREDNRSLQGALGRDRPPPPRTPPAWRGPGGCARAGLRGEGGLPGQGRRQGRPRDHMGGGRSWSPGRALPRVGQTAAAAAAAGAAVSLHLPSFPSLPGLAAQPDE